MRSVAIVGAGMPLEAVMHQHGALPESPGGDTKTEGHPPGVIGVAQCVESFGQLRGEAVIQVDRSRIGLVHNIAGRAAASAVRIQEGSGTHGR